MSDNAVSDKIPLDIGPSGTTVSDKTLVGRSLAATDEAVLPIHAETVAVSRRKIDRAVVRATRTTVSREAMVDEELASERIEVERVPIGRIVETAPPVREEGDTTIISVVEEVVVVERRLMLKEEVRLRRVRTTERHVETVVVREQKVAVTRTPLGASASSAEQL